MSALAARRAAQLQQETQIPTPAKPTTPFRAVSRSKTPSVSLEDPDSEASEQEIEAGPSKRVRYTAATVKPRYYAAPTEAGESVAVSSNPAKSVKRKRAYSPGAPVGSDYGDDSSATEGEDKSPVYAEGRANGSAISTPYGTPGPSRIRSSGLEANNIASSNFIPRRSVNVEIVSRAGLIKAGLTDISGQGMIISLAPHENISLAGVFCLMPLQQSIDIFSTSLSPCQDLQTRYPVFAPVSHPIPHISPSSSPNSASSPLLSRLSLPSHFDRSSSCTVFLVLEHQTGVEGMRAGAVPGFNTTWGDEKGWFGLKGIHAVPGSLLATCYPYLSPDTWSTALNSLETHLQTNGDEQIAKDGEVDCPVVLVKGPKRSGKSTLARAALNVLLNEYERVAWLECDLGQGEFGCGGVIGLWILDQPVFGPSFTHLRRPNRAHFLGTYTPLTCPDEYIAAIDHLLQHYKYETQYPSSTSTRSTSSRRTDSVPLIINTQGWVKGLGEELLRTLENLAQATHVFAFETPLEDHGDRQGWTSSPTLPPLPLPLTSTGRQPVVYSLEPAPASALQARYTAIDHRMVSTLSYFYSTQLQSSAFLRKWDFSTPLVAVTPYEVILGETIRAAYMIGEGADGILSDDLPLALNGSMVALLKIQHIDPDMPVYEQNRQLPPLDDVDCLGFALVRAVHVPSSDIPYMKIHLITPLSADSLARINAIAKNGAMELPTPGLMDWRDRGEEAQGVAGVPWGEVPFFEVGTGGIGVERRRWRRNLMRKGM